ncbi:hypothetical protein GCM10027261_10830 [Geodermatophilus arenarius]
MRVAGGQDVAGAGVGHEPPGRDDVGRQRWRAVDDDRAAGVQALPAHGDPTGALALRRAAGQRRGRGRGGGVGGGPRGVRGGHRRAAPEEDGQHGQDGRERTPSSPHEGTLAPAGAPAGTGRSGGGHGSGPLHNDPVSVRRRHGGLPGDRG